MIMTAKQKSILEEWGTWAFRGIVIGSIALIYNEAKQIRRDVKTLMEERGANQLRVGRAERDIDRIEEVTNNLYQIIMDHKINHNR